MSSFEYIVPFSMIIGPVEMTPDKIEMVKKFGDESIGKEVTDGEPLSNP